MTAPIDLLTPAQDALVDALLPLVGGAGMPEGLQVFQHVPEDTAPPYVMVSRITSTNLEERGEQYEEITAELVYVWRGNRRRELLAMMAGGRALVDNQTLTSETASFTRPRLDQAEAGEAIADGVTYVGMQTYKFFAEPA